MDPINVIDWAADRRYGIVIDAGSSGSRSQIYSWKDNEAARKELEKAGNSTAILPVIERGTQSDQDWQYKVEPGISTFYKNPKGISHYLEPLILHAKQVVPKNEWSKTPIFLQATAGMRLLDEDAKQRILEEICHYFGQRSPFYMASCADNIQVITGELEGIYGWTAVNYLLGGFTEESVNPVSPSKSVLQSTFGFLDMGGASTQIAFEPSLSQSRIHANDLTPVRLRLLDGKEVDHQVFSSTWLGYGTAQARRRYVEHLVAITTPDSNHLITDPCLPKGLQAHDGEPGKPALIGSGSWEECLELTQPLLNIDAPCDDSPCLFDGKHVPEIDFKAEHFVGISEYWYSSQDVFNLGDSYDYAIFAQKALEFCGRDWAEIESDFKAGGVFPPRVEIGRLEMQCFKAAWIANVLHLGIKLPKFKTDAQINGTAIIAESASDARPTFQSVDQIRGMSISWTLGKIVQEASMQGKSLSSAQGAKYPLFKDGIAGRPTAGALLALIIVTGLAYYLVRKCMASSKRGRTVKSDQYQLVTAEEGIFPTSRTGMPVRGNWAAQMLARFSDASGKYQPKFRRPSFVRNSASTPVIPLSVKNTRRTNGVVITRSESSDILNRQNSPFLRASTPPRR